MFTEFVYFLWPVVLCFLFLHCYLFYPYSVLIGFILSVLNNNFLIILFPAAFPDYFYFHYLFVRILKSIFFFLGFKLGSKNCELRNDNCRKILCPTFGSWVTFSSHFLLCEPFWFFLLKALLSFKITMCKMIVLKAFNFFKSTGSNFLLHECFASTRIILVYDVSIELTSFSHIKHHLSASV